MHAKRTPAPSTPESEVRVIGVRAHPVRDLYHGLLRLGWGSTLLVIAGAFLAANALFALVYQRIGGIEGARPRSFVDAFFFSVQTMGTIGYGAMYPRSLPANLLVVAESVVGLVVTALATGLVFAKFSLSRARIVFSDQATISPMNGVPTLSLRVGNDRANVIADGQVRLAMVRTEITHEGVTFYRMVDLEPVRDRSPAVTRSWTVMHAITPDSPLFAATPESLKTSEAELIVTLVGTDDTSLQPVHARKRYLDHEIAWGARHADVLTESSTGQLVLDIRNFHRLVPTEPTADFPYP